MMREKLEALDRYNGIEKDPEGVYIMRDEALATLAAEPEGLLAQLVDALRSVEWSSAWIDKEEVVSMTREICPYCDYKKADGHQQGCKVGDALDAALRATGEG